MSFNNGLAWHETIITEFYIMACTFPRHDEPVIGAYEIDSDYVIDMFIFKLLLRQNYSLIKPNVHDTNGDVIDDEKKMLDSS